MTEPTPRPHHNTDPNLCDDCQLNTSFFRAWVSLDADDNTIPLILCHGCLDRRIETGDLVRSEFHTRPGQHRDREGEAG